LQEALDLSFDRLLLLLLMMMMMMLRNGQLVLRLLFCVKLSDGSQRPTHLFETSDDCSAMYGCSDVYFTFCEPCFVMYMCNKKLKFC